MENQEKVQVSENTENTPASIEIVSNYSFLKRIVKLTILPFTYIFARKIKL